MTEQQFTQHLLNMPFDRLRGFLYWDYHGQEGFDIERGDWTAAMLLEAIIQGYDPAEFTAASIEYLTDFDG